MIEKELRVVRWIGSSYRDLKSLPIDAKKNFGFALDQAQRGGKHPDAKPLIGFGGARVMEIVYDYLGDTYRAVYTITFPNIVYVLHVFKKKAKSGIRTPKRDIELIQRRLKDAEFDYHNLKTN